MPEYTSPEHHPAFEEYCDTIFELAEDGVEVFLRGDDDPCTAFAAGAELLGDGL